MQRYLHMFGLLLVMHLLSACVEGVDPSFPDQDAALQADADTGPDIDGGFDSGEDADGGGEDTGLDDIGAADLGQDADTGFDLGTDVGADAGIDGGVDTGIDGGVEPDVGADAGIDGGVEPDVGADAGIDGGVEPDVGADAGIDGGVEPDVGADAGIDGGVEPDVGADAGIDGGVEPDVGADAGIDGGVEPDVGADAGIDGGFDAGIDGGEPDQGIDGGFDAGVDGGEPDQGIDAGIDVGEPDQGIDAGVDQGIDGGVDAGVDGGDELDAGDADAELDAGVDGGGGVDAGKPPFEANFLWRPITFVGAIDFGADVQEVPNAEPAGPVELREVAEESGLSGVTGGGEQHGVGVAFVDVNNDGYDDLFFATGRINNDEYVQPSLHLNLRDGRFEDISTRLGDGESNLANILAGADTYSVAAADYDMDGDIDLYVTMHPTDKLLQNNGRGGFSDVTRAAGAGGPSSQRNLPGRGSASKIASWGDYDGDGFIDIVVASSTFQQASPSPNGYILKNLGNGRFRDVTDDTSLVISNQGNPCAVLWSDFDNDGDQDLWVWNDRGNAQNNRVLLENRNGSFVNVTAQLGVNGDHGHPMGIDSADVNRDGYLDYYISDLGNNPLYAGSASGVFTDVSAPAGVGGEFGWGLGFEDLNLDGWVDIFVAQEDDLPYLTFTHSGVLNSSRVPSFTQAEWPHALIQNRGAAHNVGVAFADYDHNGSIDIASATTDRSNVNLFRNDTQRGGNHYLEVKIVRAPRTGARGGISARVVVKTGDVIQFKDIKGGSSRASQNSLGVRFGLGAWTGAEWVAVLWPDGRELSALNVPGDQILELGAR